MLGAPESRRRCDQGYGEESGGGLEGAGAIRLPCNWCVSVQCPTQCDRPLEPNKLTCCSLSLRDLRTFCSGLGVLAVFSSGYAPLSSKLRIEIFSPRELSEWLTLAPGVGDGPAGVLASLGLTAPLSVGICDPTAGPSADLMLRVAAGNALPCCFFDDLNKKDMADARL